MLGEVFAHVLQASLNAVSWKKTENCLLFSLFMLFYLEVLYDDSYLISAVETDNKNLR